MNAFTNPAYLLPPLLAALCSAGLLALVAGRALHSSTHRSFAAFLLVSGAGSFLIFLMRSSPDAASALAWERQLLPLVFMSAFAFYAFTQVYTRTSPNRLLTSAAVVYVLAVLGLGVSEMLVDYMAIQSYGYAPVFLPAFYAVAVGGYLWMALAFRNVYQALRTSETPDERSRLRYILAAATLPLIGSTLDILPSTYPTGILGNLAFAMITLVAMTRHRLLSERPAVLTPVQEPAPLEAAKR